MCRCQDERLMLVVGGVESSRDGNDAGYCINCETSEIENMRGL